MVNNLKITVINDEISDDLNETIKFLKQYGIEYVELRTIGKKNLINYSLTDVEKIYEALKKSNIAVSAFASPIFKWYVEGEYLNQSKKIDTFGFNPCLSTQDKQRYIVRAIEVAKVLRTKNVRIFSSLETPNTDYSFLHDPLLKFALDEAKKQGITLLIENELPCHVNKMQDIKMITDKLAGKNLRAWFDVSNFYKLGRQVLLEDLRLMKNNIGYFHLKDFDRDGRYVALGKGVINYRRVISDVKEVFNDKEVFLSVETHVSTNPKGVTAQSLANLKEYLTEKRVGYAIIGCGNIAHKYVAAINASKEGELRYSFDIDPRRGKTFASKHDVENAKNFSDLLRRDIDIICVCTPHHTHAGYIVKILSANKYCLCEKPLCLHGSEINKIVKARNFRTHLFVSFQKRYNKPVTRLLELIKLGKLGQIQLVSVALRWSRKDDYFRGKWQGEKRKAGGLLFNQGAHLLDLMRIIGGPPKRLTGFSMKKLRPKASELEDIYSGTFEFGRGGIGVVEATTALPQRNHQESIFVLGTKGYAEVTGPSLNKFYHLQLMGGSDQGSIDGDYGSGHHQLIEKVNRFISYGESDPLLPRGSDGVLTTRLIRFMYGDREKAKS